MAISRSCLYHGNWKGEAEDWMLDPSIFSRYKQQYGPFDVDACYSDDGNNAQETLMGYWSPSENCLKEDWGELTVFCNPPWRLTPSVVGHFLECKIKSAGQQFPTKAVMVLPCWPWMEWYPTVLQDFDIVDYFPAGSRIFTARMQDCPTSTDALEQRMNLGPYAGLSW